LARKQKSNLRWKSIKLKPFEDADTAWLAELFQELVPRHPKLTIEKFAKDHGVDANLISRLIDEERGKKNIVLWHGTTDDRAKAIMKEGFRAIGGRKIWFTRNTTFARSHAIGRSQQRYGEAPVVFRCNIDLKKYSDFENHKPHRAFKCSHISPNVIRRVFRLEPDYEDNGELVDFMITKTTRKTEVLRWINQYLYLINEKSVDENHPVVEEIFKWVETQYASGRETPISDEEMLVQMSKISIQQAAKHFGVGTQVIQRWISDGRIKAKSVRGHLVVPIHVKNIQNKRYRNIVTLWHGTTEDRAKAIMEEGFKTGKGKVWFTTEHKFARRHAIGRAGQRRGETPVVISCEVDLEKYQFFKRVNKKTYVFYSPTDKESLGKEVIRDISVVKEKFSKRSKEKKGKQQSVDVIVTQNAGKLGVLCWINSYLELEGKAALTEDHSAVGAIFRWVEAQYAEGRDEPISDEEMLVQVMTHLKYSF